MPCVAQRMRHAICGTRSATREVDRRVDRVRETAVADGAKEKAGPMSERFDAIVIGAGISGETCARRLRHAGMRVALDERHPHRRRMRLLGVDPVRAPARTRQSPLARSASGRHRLSGARVATTM